MVVFVFYGFHIHRAVSLAHLIMKQVRSFLYIFRWLFLFMGVKYRMSEAKVVDTDHELIVNPIYENKKKPQNITRSNRNRVGAKQSNIHIGDWSGVIYYDTSEDESDKRPSQTTKQKQKSNRRSSPKSVVPASGGRRKTRRPSQTKRRRVHKKK